MRQDRHSEKIQFSYNANYHLMAELKWKSRRINVPVAWIINRAVREYLDRHPREQEDAERELYETPQAET